jgi:hypothetical protein
VVVCVIIYGQQLSFTKIMDINILVQRLQHGESFQAYNCHGEPYQVNHPPSHLSINAAKVIVALNAQVEQLSTSMLSIQNQLNELSDEYESFKKNQTTSTTSP